MFSLKNSDKKKFISEIVNIFEGFLSEKVVEILNEERNEASHETQHPEDLAIICGSDHKQLRDELRLLIDNFNSPVQKGTPVPSDLVVDSNTKLADIGLPDRCWHALARSGFFTVGDVRDLTQEQLCKNVKQFGESSYDVLRDKLLEFGIELPGNQE